MNANGSPQSSAEQEQLALETLRKQQQEIFSYLNSIKLPMSPAQIASVLSTLQNWITVFESYKSQKESEWPEFSQQLDLTLKDLRQAMEIYRNMYQSTSSTPQQIQKLDSSTTLYPSTGRTEQHFQQILGTNENLTDEGVPQTPSTSPSPSKKQPNIAIAMHALSDAPADKQQDLLGFEIYATALSDFILNEKTEKPLRIMIDAPWGMGKTTLMQMIKAQLESQSKQRLPSLPLIVWFNAWMYDKEESLWAAFILNVLQDVRKKFSWFQRAKLWLRLN